MSAKYPYLHLSAYLKDNVFNIPSYFHGLKIKLKYFQQKMTIGLF